MWHWLLTTKAQWLHTLKHARLVGHPSPNLKSLLVHWPCLSLGLLFSPIQVSRISLPPHFSCFLHQQTPQMRSLDLPSLTFITSFPGPTLQANKLCLHQARGTVLPQCPPPGQIHKHVFCPKAAWLPLEVFHTASSVILHYLGSSDLFFSYSANLPISLVCICFYKFHCQLIHLVLLWITVIKTSRSLCQSRNYGLKIQNKQKG